MQSFTFHVFIEPAVLSIIHCTNTYPSIQTKSAAAIHSSVLISPSLLLRFFRNLPFNGHNATDQKFLMERKYFWRLTIAYSGRNRKELGSEKNIYRFSEFLVKNRNSLVDF